MEGMIKSMTGFGKATGVFNEKRVNIEIRSLNSKSLDINTRIAQFYKEFEPEIRKRVNNKLHRGKIDIVISVSSIGTSNAPKINQDLAVSYFENLRELNDRIGQHTEDYLSLILCMPDIYDTPEEDLGDEEKDFVIHLLEDATDQLNEFRKKEGKELESEFKKRITEIRNVLTEIPMYEDERIQVIRDRMKKGLEEIQTGNYDENRLEQEMIFYLEKLDISEEKMRLSNHLDYFLNTMKTENSGKKLGFISQEIGREINTLGSKSNHAEMQALVIGMKDSLEKIKEQILNTL